MKVVLSGATGYIGSQVLSHCLNHPSITSVLILTRRALGPAAQHPKAKVILVSDFTAYDETTLTELKTANAAIWCLGTFNGDEKVDIDFPLAFINAVKSRPTGSSPFRYVQLSGAFVEPPPKEGEKERSLWYFASGRRVRGAAEARVLATSDDTPESEFRVYVVKPGGVLPQNMSLLQKCVFGDDLTVTINELGATMVDLAVRGNEKNVFSSRDIVRHARELLK